MATVIHNDRTGNYEVVDHGRVVSTHKTAETAKREGKRYGKKMGQAVSYKGPRMDSTVWIHRTSPDEQAEPRKSGTGGFLDWL